MRVLIAPKTRDVSFTAENREVSRQTAHAQQARGTIPSMHFVSRASMSTSSGDVNKTRYRLDRSHTHYHFRVDS